MGWVIGTHVVGWVIPKGRVGRVLGRERWIWEIGKVSHNPE